MTTTISSNIESKQRRVKDIQQKYRMSAQWFAQFSENDRYMYEAVEDMFLRVYGKRLEELE